MRVLRALGVGLMVVGLMVAVPVAAIAIDLHGAVGTSRPVAVMPAMSPGAMSGMMGSASSGGAAADQLTIVHVTRGCHVWLDGTSRSATMRLQMQPGQVLRILNQDVDMHRLVELSGPALRLGGPMATGGTQAMTFAQPGVYRFGTKVLPMAGMADVATKGPDNVLRLTVTVA